MKSDEELALRVQQGRMEEFTVLVERHYSPLLGYLYRLTGGKQALAEDMVQETFLRLLRGISLYQPSRAFKTWLYTISTNIARNHYQLADTRYADNPAEDAEYLDERDAPEATLIASQEAQAVLDALAQLPEHQREVVILFYYQELPQAQIAEILRIPVGTVKSRLSLGLRRLRELIQRMDNNHERLA